MIESAVHLREVLPAPMITRMSGGGGERVSPGDQQIPEKSVGSILMSYFSLNDISHGGWTKMTAWLV